MMKTTIKLLALAFVLFATACSNDDEINMLNSLWRNVTQNEARIDDLEKWCAQANTNITSLQTIVNVLESNGMVTSITPVMEGGVEIGYTITFSNHDPITIYHGKDGKDGQNGANGQNGTSPIVGVAQHTDGVYYWTLNGEWLLDENGNKLRVSGADGKDGADGADGQNGITPQLKIENDYWYVSYNNGSTWTELGKAKGEDGENGQNGAKGDKGDKGDTGDSMFRSVTQDADNVYFTLANGTVITIAKGGGSTDQPNSDFIFTITYDPNGGEGERVVDTVYYGNSYTIKSDFNVGFSKVGYIVYAWNTKSDGSGANYITDNKISVTKNIILYAKWERKIPLFSVSSTKKVIFSPGNLQYHPANDAWRFAENQTDYIGDANSNISGTYNGWLDLFGWSTSSTNFGVSTSTDWDDYYGSFVDWGTNQIGADAPNTWRTLSYDEWEYLLETRTNASSLKGVAQVNGVNGLILLPDDWVCPEGVTFKSGFHSRYYAAYQTFTAAQWSQLEAAGAVFLPAAGDRSGSSVLELDVQYYGDYWSATEEDSNGAYYLTFYSGKAGLNYRARDDGLSVRLVQDL